MILGTRFSILGTQIGSVKHLKKTAFSRTICLQQNTIDRNLNLNSIWILKLLVYQILIWIGF